MRSGDLVDIKTLVSGMRGPPLWSSSMVDLIWSPPRSIKQLWAPKAHLLGEWMVYGKSVKDGVICVASFVDGKTTSQSRASEAVALLNVVSAGAPVSSGLNFLERGILDTQQVYVARNGFNHPTVPTISDYHLVMKPLAKLAQGVSSVTNSSLWAYASGRPGPLSINIAKTVLFYLAEGNLLRMLRLRPSAAIAIVMAGASAVLMYYNLAVWGAATRVFGLVLDGWAILIAWLVGQFGEPAGKFVFAVSLLYIMMTIALCGLGMLKLLGRLLRSGFGSLGFVSDSVLKSGCGDVERSGKAVSAPSVDVSLHDQPMTSACEMAAPSLSDVSSADSAICSLGGCVVTSRRVCQARLLHYDNVTATAVALKPSLLKHVVTIPMLNRDCLLRNGARSVGVGGPVLINLRKHRRESYAVRTIERKCQTKGCRGEGILLEHRGKKFLERRIHLQVRLGQFEPPAHGPLEQRRDSRVRGRDSSVDTNFPHVSAKPAVSKDVSFEDGRDSSCSNASTVSMPDLQEAKEEVDEILPPPRTSTLSDVSVPLPLDSSGDTCASKIDMANAASDLMKRTGRRNSMPDMQPCAASSRERDDSNGYGPNAPRVKAYSFGDTPIRKPQRPSVTTYAPQPVLCNPSTIVLQGRIAQPPTPRNTTPFDHGMPSGSSTIRQGIRLSSLSMDNRSVSNVAPSTTQPNADLGMMYPDFLCKRVVPGKHMVVPIEVDHSWLMESDKERLGTDASCGDIGALLKLKSEKWTKRRKLGTSSPNYHYSHCPGLGSLKPNWAHGRIIGGKEHAFCASDRLIKIGWGETAYGSQFLLVLRREGHPLVGVVCRNLRQAMMISSWVTVHHIH